jgi:transposase
MTTPDETASEGGRRQRRWWSDEDKARIVAECDRPGVSVSMVARRHDLNANLLFSWRRQFRDRPGGVGEISFVPAVIAPQERAADRPAAMPAEPQPVLASNSPPRPLGRVEIVLGDSRRIIVDEDVSAAALGRVIGVLERR